MRLNIPKILVDKAIAFNGSASLIKAKDDQLRIGRRTTKFVEVNGLTLERDTLKFLHNETKDSVAEYANTIEFLYNAIRKPGATMIKSVDDVLPALVAYCKSAGIKNYLFERGPYKMVLPYAVIKIEGLEGRGSRGYASRNQAKSTVLYLAYAEKCLEQSRNINFGPETLSSIFSENGVEYKPEYKTEHRGGHDEYVYLVNSRSEVGVSVDKLLSHHNLFLETPELHTLLDSQLTKYLTCIKNYGKQFLVRGTGTAITNSWYSSGETSMLVEARPGRAVMDTVLPTMKGEDEDRGSSSNRKRRYRDDDDDEDDNDESNINASPLEMEEKFAALTLADLELTIKSNYPGEDQEVIIPNHPKVKIFHLTKSQSFWVHVNNLNPYKYREGMEEQLILPAEVKAMTRMLVTNSADDSEDIIEGKTQSTIIAAVGDPGLGKTLMCEVLSESCQKPLYKVQAAQLGETPEELEKNLQRILLRAQRWNAILLIDEANAYIHSRGHDIRQNAIVGVFLRLLDYYRGILIFTTNMTQGVDSGDLGFDIDQAIISRCTAVIKFNLPDKSQAKQLWQVQCKLRGLEMEPALLEKLVEKYTLSGRTIRNLLKMACSSAANMEEELGFKHFQLAAKFVPMSMQEQSVQK